MRKITIKKLICTLSVSIWTAWLLAQPARLIVRSDDMGVFHSVNAATVDTYLNGISTSVEVMPIGPWFPEAARMLNEHPALDAGIHLAITSEWDLVKWRPLTHAPSLTDSDGYFHPRFWPNTGFPGHSLLESDWKLSEIEAEFRAQIELALKYIPHASHLSGHMGAISFDKQVLEMVTRLAKEYKLIFLDGDAMLERYNVRRASYEGPKRTFPEKESSFINMLDGLQKGRNYLFVDHPAWANAEMEAVGHVGYEDVGMDRQGVTDLLKSEKVKQAIKRNGIELISYQDLIKE